MLDANANVMNTVTAVVSIFTKDEEAIATIRNTTAKGSVIGAIVGFFIGAIEAYEAQA